MSRIAKGPLRTRCSNQALAQIAKGGGLRPSHLDCEPCIKMRGSCWSGGKPSTLASGLIGVPRGNGDSVMRNRIDIDYSHSRAIVQEIGERLRASLEIDRELPASLRMQIDRLRQFEGPSQPNVARSTPRWTRSPRTRIDRA